MTPEPSWELGADQAAPEPPEFTAALRGELGDEAYEAGWHQVIARDGPVLRGFVASLAGDAVDDDELDDLLQDVWYRAFTKIHQYRGTGRLRSWLFAVARNKFLNHYRDTRRAERVSADVRADDYEAVADPAVERRLRDAEGEDVLREWLLPLSKRDRAVVDMRLGGFSNAEIAEKLNFRSAATVATTVYRIYAWLAPRLASESMPSTEDPRRKQRARRRP